MGYEVKKGDGWYKIAKNLGVNVNELLKANNATIDTMIHPGQKLKNPKIALVSKQGANELETGKLVKAQNEPQPKLVKGTRTPTSAGGENMAYVSLNGYKAYGFLPTGHAGVVIKDDSGMYSFYDFGTKHSSKSGFTKLNQETSNANTDYRRVDLGKNLTDEELGNALSQYFPDNTSMSFYWKSGNANEAIKYINNRAKTNINNYNGLTNNCSSEAECAMEAAGIDFDGLISSIKVPAWNTPENSRKYEWKKTVTPEEEQLEMAFLQLLDDLMKAAQAVYDSEYKGKTPEEIRQIALTKSRDKNARPNTNFMTATDMMDEKKLKASRNTTKSYSNCINTITGFFNPTQTVSSNISFTQTPGAYGFEEIAEADAQPGDVGILHNTDDHPYHAVMLDSKAADGSWNLNYSNGSDKYRLGRNISAFKAPDQTHKLNKVKYYRYVGDNNGFLSKATRSVAPALRFLKSMF